ncbi:cytochrome P450 2W1 isoform X2 [Opisthocomus hoazin]|uniref:cytochrome P450 2W1 isoform X2 n=1 Tax=Opisthocomus hoazin TaxID=30419 RepID=UPI003F534BB5
MAVFIPLFICGVCALLLSAAFYVFKVFKESALNLPPGPFPLPIIGNLHLLDIRRQDKSLMKISEKYGPVFTIHFGFQKVVVLTGYEAVKDALLNMVDVFADRPAIPIFHHIQHGNGAPFQLQLLNMAPTNITFAILFGRRFDYEDPTFLTLLRLIDEVMHLLGSPFVHLFNYYPFLGFLLKPHKTILKKVEEVCVILKKYIKKSKESIKENNLTSYIDALVFKQEEQKKSNTLFDDANVLASALDLLMAGSETTSTTLQWAILLMMKYPEIQKKVQAEIEQVLVPGCLPTCNDRKNMPYTNAVIHEVQRFVTLLPHVPRCTSVATHFKGYFIPKGATVIPLLTSVLLDKAQWETPDEFNPNHFLDADGNFVKKKAFLPFSTGRRNCLGESLATMELFIFFTGLMQKFTFKPPPGVKESELDTMAESGFTMRPHPQCACAELRQ